MKFPKAVKQFVASVLCVSMMVSVMPMQIFADEISNDAVNVIFDEASTEATVYDETIVSEETPEDEAIVSENQSSEDENDVSDDNETQLSDEDEMLSSNGGWKYRIVNGYAVITGYTDTSVTALNIPYQIDGYYVNGIGEGAFVENVYLSSMYIHGNVISIADNAFNGNNIVLSGYNGTTVLSYAKSHGIQYKNVTDTTYFTFTDNVIDYSYAQSGRFIVIDESTIKFNAAEAAQLNVGSIIYIPQTVEDLLYAYSVTSMVETDGWVTVTVEKAAVESAIKEITMKDIPLTADWSKAVWADGVELVEEKIDETWKIPSIGIPIKYEKEFGKQGKFKVSADGRIGIDGLASVDASIWKQEIYELEFVTNPYASMTFKVEGDTDKIDDHMDVYLCSVPLFSIFKVVEIQAAVYLRVSVNGSVTVTLKGGGKVGTRLNTATNTMEGINEWKWEKPNVEAEVNFEVGPMVALKLNAAFIGDILSLEFFGGVTVTAKATLERPRCVDLSIGAKIYAKLCCEAEILKKVLSGKLGKVTVGFEFVLFEVTAHIGILHWEKGNGLVLACTEKYPDSSGDSGTTTSGTYDVKFNSFTSQTIQTQRLKKGDKVTEPSITLAGNTLEGWYTDKNFTTKWDFANDTVSKSMVLYAKWANAARTVTFECNYEKSDFTQEVVPGSKITQPSAPMWIDHVFDGWFKDAELTEAWNFSSDVMPDNDITLYGKWTYQEGYDPYIINQVSKGEITYNGHSYTHFATYKSYSEAKAYCESLGGYLVTITSAGEQAALEEYVNYECAQDYVWLGITSEGNWDYWQNGEKVTYTNWSEGSDPGANSVQYNGVMKVDKDGTWTALDNGDTAHFVCEWGSYSADPNAGKVTETTDVRYVADDATGTATVVGWNNDVEDYVIERSYKGYPVTAIDAKAFYNNKTMKSVTIPNTVTSIGANAFQDCIKLQSVVIPNSVTTIGQYAFADCDSLTSAVVGNGVTNAGTYLFNNDTALTTVVWSSAMTSIPNYTFRGCTSLASVSNINNVKAIGTYAFYNCRMLSDFKYPSNLETIGTYAFYYNYLLPNADLPESVTSIGSYAFYYCKGMTSVTVPAGITTLPSYAFYGCSALTTVTLPRSVTSIVNTAFNNSSATYRVYRDSYALTWVEGKGYTVEIIGSSASRVKYELCIPGSAESSVTSVADAYINYGERIPEPEVSVAGYALKGWYTDPGYYYEWNFATDTVKEENITLYAKWAEIQSNFEYTVSGEKATITNYIGTEANVVVPETIGGYPVKTIAANAISDDFIKTITIPKSVTNIESGAFAGCSGLEEFILVDSNSFKVEDGVLYTKNGLKLICAPRGRNYNTFTVPAGVQTIGTSAFEYHTELKEITIPESVVTIGNFAFAGIYSLNVYGPLGTCAAKTFANKYLFSYNMYDVKFYDGTKLVHQLSAEAGELIKGDFTTITQDFFRFGGWFQDKNLTMEWNFATNVMPSSDMDLYLKWTSDFGVTLNNDEIKITGYTGSIKDVIIPETINGYPVTGIAANAFTKLNANSVTIPSTVTSIASGAIATAVKIIGDDGSAAQTYAASNGNTFALRKYTVTFDSMNGSYVAPIQVESGAVIELPTPIRTNYYFGGWYTGTDFIVQWTDTDTMPSENITLYALWRIANNNVDDNFAYDILADGTIEITAYSGSKSSLVIPDTINGYTVSGIGDYAFKGNDTLLTVTIPDSVKTIGDYAFSDTAIRVIKGGAGIETIGNSAFSYSSGLRTMTLPEGLVSIGNNAFFYCTSMTEISMPDSLRTIGYRAFTGCTYLDEVIIPLDIVSIGSEAFKDTMLTAVTLPSTLKGKVNNVFDDGVVITYVGTSNLEILELKQATKNSVNISWSEVTGASGYTLYRKDGENGSFKRVKAITGLSTGNYNLAPGTYTYKLEAYDSDSVVLAESNEVTIQVVGLGLTNVISINQKSATTAEMTISKVTDADGYEVYRAYTVDGEYSLLKTMTSVTTINSGLIGGIDYYYKVRAYRNETDGTVSYGEWSDVYFFHMPFKYVAAPENLFVYQSSAKTVDISWDEVDNAAGYVLYRSVNGGAFARVKEVTENYTQNYNLVAGNTYTYKVHAFFSENFEAVYGEFSEEAAVEILSLTTPVIESVVQKKSDTVNITWTAVSGADGYTLYRATEENGTFSRVKDVTDTTTGNYSLTKGQTYYYKVRAYTKNTDGSYEYGGYSKAYGITINALESTAITEITQTASDEVTLKWNAVSGATGYEVWYNVNGTSEYELVTESTARTTVIDNLNDGVKYYFQVRGYVVDGTERIYGDFSDEMYIQVMGSPEITVLEQCTATSVDIMWSKVPSADGYELWRSVDGADFARVKFVTANTTKNYNLEAESTYSYKVRAYTLNDDGSKSFGIFSEADSVKIVPIPVISSVKQSAANSVTIKWAAVKGAEGYDLYRSTVEDGIYTRIKSVDGTSTGNYNLTVGETYYYKIAAYTTVNGVKKYSVDSVPRCITILAAPEITSIEPLSSSSVTLTWTAVENATGYMVYRSETKDGVYQYTKKVTETTASNYSLTADKYYYYKVAAYIDEDNASHIGIMSAANQIYLTNIPAPEITSITQPGATSLSISWSAASGATGYEVQRAEAEDGVYGVVASVSSRTLKNYSLTSGKTYYYKIRPYKIVDGNRVYGITSAVRGATIIAAPVISNVCQANPTSAIVTWAPVENATSYILYRSESASGPFVYAKTSTETSATNYNLTTGKTYYYKVAACITNGVINSTSAQSGAKSVTLTNLGAPRFTNVTQSGAEGAYLRWVAVEGAEGYELVKSTTEDGTYSYVKYVTSNTTNTYSLTEGSSYWFKVRAYSTVNGKKVYGAYSESGKITMLGSTTATYIYQESSDSITFNWNAAANAEGYEISRKTGNGAYAVVGTTTDLSYTDTGLSTGKVYTYRVRPYTAFKTLKSYGSYSDVLSLKTISFTDGTYPETAHNYTNSMDETWTYTISGADALLLKFNASTAFEGNYDKLYITDAEGNTVGSSYYSSTTLADKYIKVSGDTVNLRMTSDGSVTKYGFKFDFIKPTFAD